MSEVPSILKVENLSVSFHSKDGIYKAVDNLSFVLKEAEVLGIVGESGSGKSLTSLSIMQLLPGTAEIPEASKIIYNSNKEVDLLSLKETELRRIRGNEIAMIFQEPMTSLNPVMRCGRQLTESLKLHKKVSKKEAKKIVLEGLVEVGLKDIDRVYRSYPFELSGGQRQRLMIAMALICKPKVLIADEPTTALDVTVQKGILQLLLELKDKYKLSILFISHDLGVISEISDRILVMKSGEMKEIGAAQDILNKPENPYTQALIKCRPSEGSKDKRLSIVEEILNGDTENQSRPDLDKVTQETILKVNGLEVKYPIKKNFLGKTTKSFNAVKQIDLEVNKGETLGLVGESGCGKSSLGRSLMMLVKRSGGKVIFKGEEIDIDKKADQKKLWSKMQFVFQDPFSSLNPNISIGRAILEPILYHNRKLNQSEGIEKVKWYLEKTGLPKEYFDRYPHQLSGGQRQRVCIARALAMEPEFLICDESVSALDVSVQAQVLNLLNDLKAELGLTYIFISHDLSVVHYMADRIIVMKDGEIMEQGKSDDIWESPQHPYTRKLIESIPKI